MNATIPVILLALAAFLAAILSLAASKSLNSRIMGVCAVIAIGVGTLSYGYGYSLDNGSIHGAGFSISVVLKTLLSVCRMFGGVNDFAAVRETPLFAGEAMVSLFWAAHFMAFYLTASAAIAVLGKRMMKYLRTLLLRRGALCLVYDATPDSIRLAGQKPKGGSMAFICERTDETVSVLADELGAVEFQGGRNLCADEKFLKTLGVHDGRALDVYCVGDDAEGNLRYAEALLDALQARSVSPEATSLFLLGISEERAARLQALEGRYGYGTLFACDRYALVARLIVEKRPPWGFLRCDENARALNDLRVFVVGFGRMGQATLRQLLINGQMEGSAFHAEVFDRRMSDLQGAFEACYPALMAGYDIVLHAADADSGLFYERLAANTPDMIVLCAGSRKQNAELADTLRRLYRSRADQPCVVQCATDAALIDGVEYRLENVDVRGMDRAAMILNHVYCGGPSAEADWKNCDSFNRASCRASADFMPAFLHAAGVTREEVLAGHWPPNAVRLENLSRTEHLRWCAFHLAMGYLPMSEAEYRQRCDGYRRGEVRRIGKNGDGMTHACLIPWEALDGLSRRENEVTGGSVDYKAMDTDNVLAVPDILRQLE